MKSLTKKGGKPVINKFKPIWGKLWSYENNSSDISSEPIYPITEEELLYINFYNKLYYLNDKEKNAEIQKLMEKGSSSKLDPSLSTTNIPTYLDDTWWSKGY